MEPSISATTILALGSVTGAALCCLLGVMQWRSGPLTGFDKLILWLWLVAFLWNVGGFIASILGLAGVPAESQTMAIAMLIAWGPTSVGPALILRAVNRGIPSQSRFRRALLSVSTALVSVVLTLMVASVFLPAFPLTFAAANLLSLLSAMLHAGACGLIYLAQRRRQRDNDGRMPRRHWLLPFAVTLIGLNFVAGLIFFYAPVEFDTLRTIAFVAVTQQIIPWAIAVTAFQAESSYADVELKRSLILVASVLIAAIVAWWIPGLPRGLPVVATSLLGAGLILAAPSFHRLLNWFVDRMLLKRPEYPALTTAFADASRRTANQAELFGLARKSIEDALRVEVDFIPISEISRAKRLTVKHIPFKDSAGAEFVMELIPTVQGRILMQEELTFLNAIAAETTRRLESLEFERERRELQLNEERLRHSATEAELKALRAQVDPHFLFNTLNTIADLISTDPQKAESMTERLSEFFRYTLSRSERTLSTLDQELEFVRHYLDIEQVRFGERLRVELAKDAELGQEMVPSLILQPLVENAVRHGLAPKLKGGRISITAAAEGKGLRLQVVDDGVGMRGGTAHGSGIGLQNVRERLRALYRDAASMSIESGPHGEGTCITLLLPR